MQSSSNQRISTKEGATDDPPAFEEMMRTPAVFYMFLSYLVDQLATENLFFLQTVRIYRYLKRPQAEIDDIGRYIISIFCLPGAPSEVNISAETRASLAQAFLQPNVPSYNAMNKGSSSVYTPTLFDTAYAEIRTLLAQPYGAWIATNEWKRREILNSMRRLKPPSFSTVLCNKTLCEQFRAFLQDKVGPDNEEYDSFLFCVDAERYRQTALSGIQPDAEAAAPNTRPRKMSDASADFNTGSIPVVIAKKDYSSGNNSDDDLSSNSSDVRSRRSSEAKFSTEEDLILGPSESVSLEKLARTIVKKHRMPKKSKQLSYRLHLSSQFDRLTSFWGKAALFTEWQKKKDWADVMFKDPVTLRQSKSSSGILEYPTLAATLMSLFSDPHRSGNGVGTLFKYMMNFTSYPKDLEFMEAVLKFRKKFAVDNPDRGEMADAARNLFNTFLAPVKIADVSPHSPCPQFLTNPLIFPRPRHGSSPQTSPPMAATVSSPELAEGPLVTLCETLNNELRSILWSPSIKTKVFADMFRRAGTYVYRRAQNTWFRELCASHLWVFREFENESEQTEKTVSYLGDFSVIEGISDATSDPILYDDIVENSNLYMKFLAVIPSTRKPILDVLDRISAFSMKPVQTLREARAVRSAIKRSEIDNLVVRKLIKNMKSYLDLENVAAPFHDDGNTTPPTEGTALVSSAMFDFVRTSLIRQLLAENAEKFSCHRTSRKMIVNSKRLHFFKYVEPLHEAELALTTKNVVQTQCTIVQSNSSSNSKSSSGSGVRTPSLNVIPLSLDVPMEPTDEPPATVNPVPGKRASILGFLRGSSKQTRHSPLVRHVRTPGSTDGGFVRSPDTLYASPKVNATDPVLSSHLAETTFSSSSSSSSSLVMTVPYFEEVLGSAYFRRMLTDCYFCRVEEDESNAWDDLSLFYSKFSKLDDETIARSQDAIIKAAKKVIKKNREFFNGRADELEKLLSSEKPITVTSNFFRKLEKTLFTQAYDAFVSYLLQKGWKVVPCYDGSDDDLMFM